MLSLCLHWVLSCECIPVVVKWLDDSCSPVDFNTMSTVPEYPRYGDFDMEVSDILTSTTSGMEIHNIIDWTCIVDFSFECNAWFQDTTLYTKCSQQDILYSRAYKAGHVVEVTHTLLVTSRVYWMSQPNALTSKTALMWDNKTSYLSIN